MGSQGRTGLSRLLMGSTTERVVREMPCSIITLKQEHVIRFPLEKEVADIERHFRRGNELLGKQLTEEAIAQFEYCIRKDVFFVHAWEGMAIAYRQMGKKKEQINVRKWPHIFANSFGTKKGPLNRGESMLWRVDTICCSCLKKNSWK
jgi:hypothetical protein